MTTQDITPRELAYQYVEAALATGVRGSVRSLLKEARLALQASSKGPSLTDVECRNIKMGQVLRDASCPGLTLRRGARSGCRWIYRYKANGSSTPKELVLGNYPEVGLSEARERWDAARGFRSKGDDPARHTLSPLNSTKPLTVSDLVSRFVADYSKATKRSWGEDERLLRRHVIPRFGDLAAKSFGHPQAMELLHDIHRFAPREAEKLRAVLSTMFNFASGRTRKIFVKTPLLPPTHDNPVASVLLPQRRAQNYKPTRTDLAAYLAGLDAMCCGEALRLQILTMTRIGEVAGLPWSELDLEGGRWTLPGARAKNGREHLMLLSRQALDLLVSIQEAQAQDGISSPYVFPSPRNQLAPRTVNNIQHHLAVSRPALGLPEQFTSHSLRHAALTWAAENGCPREVRDRLTNHVSGGGVDAIYNGAALNHPAGDWWQGWADYLGNLEADNVIDLNVRAVGF